MKPNLLGLLALTVVAISAPPAAADDAKDAKDTSAPSADEAAATFLARGNEAFKQGRFADAEDAYRRAWSFKKGHDIAGNLGAAELAQGKHKEAAQHLAATLRLFPVTGRPALREQMARAFAEARSHVGAVRVVVEPTKGASIRVDGTPQGEAPLADDVFVDPGDHVVEAALPGYVAAAARVRVQAGGSADLHLTLVPLPRAERRGAPRRRDVVPGLALGGVAALGLAGGAAFLGIASTRRSEAEALGRSIVGDHRSCVAGAANYDAPRCPTLRDQASSYATLHDLAVGSLVAGGVAAAGAAAYFLWPAGRRDTAGRDLRVTPVFADRRGGVMVSAEF